MITEFEMKKNEKYFLKSEITNDFTKSLSLFVSIYGEFYALKDYFTKRTGMKSYLIIYTLDGQGEMQYAEKTFRLSKDSIIIINCDNFQFYKTTEDFWHFYFIHIENQNLKSIIDSLFDSDYIYLEKNNDINLMQDFEKILNNNIFNSKIKALTNEKTIIEILTKIYNLNNFNNNISYDIYSEVDKYIQNNYLNDITLDEICKRFGFSKFHFIRVFKKYKSISPYEYVISLRLSYAKHLITITDKSIEEIAILSHYDCSTNFIRAFKKANGFSPASLRK